MTVLAHHPKGRGICRYSLLPASPQVRGEGHDLQASRGISASPQGASGTYGDGGGSWLFLGWDYGGKGRPQPSGPPQGCWPATTVPLCFRSRGYASSRTVPLSEPSSRWHLVGRTAKLVRVPRKFSELSLVVLEAEGPWKA